MAPNLYLYYSLQSLQCGLSHFLYWGPSTLHDTIRQYSDRTIQCTHYYFLPLILIPHSVVFFSLSPELKHYLPTWDITIVPQFNGHFLYSFILFWSFHISVKLLR